MADGTFRVTVVHSPGPREVHEQVIEVAAGSTVADALRISGLALPADADTVGVWGRKAEPTQVLREGDRVEVCRPLLVDPKVARRERFRRQGARGAGLFASRRPGAKPGY